MPLPGGASGCVIVAMSLAQTTVVLPDTGKATSFAALVHGVHNPVDPGVAADGFVVGVHEDNFVVLVYTILVDPVGVQDPQVSASPSNTLFSLAPQTPLGLDLVHTMTDGLAVGSTLVCVLFAVTTADSDAVDNVALLSFVTEAAGLIRARRAGGTVNHVELTVLPASNAEEEAEDIRLFFLVEFTDILVGAHLAA